MELQNANRNPWYILMTLFGEQDAAAVDLDLANRNRAAWNGWISGRYEGGKLADFVNRGVDGLRPNPINYETAKHFHEVWQDRNGADAPRHAMPGPSADIFLRDLEFAGSLCLDGFLLPKVRFTNCHFQGRLTAQRAVCDGGIALEHCVTEGNAKFQNLTVAGRASFRETRFRQVVRFDEAEFEGVAKFNGVGFGREAIFSYVQFHRFADFYQARFGAVVDHPHHFTFANATFHAPVSFEGAAFPVRLPVLSGTTLPTTTTVTARDGLWPERGQGWGQWLDEGLRLRVRRDWQPLEEVKASAAALRHAMARQTLPEEEHFFFRREMYAATRLDAPKGWLTWAFYEVPSDYGGSVLRPALFLVALLLAGWWVFTAQTDFGAGEALGYSFANMFKFFGLQRTYFEYDAIRAWPGWLQWVSGAQTVFAFVFLFFLGLGLRTRFRLR